MPDDPLQQIEKEVQQLQEELHATQARLQQVMQQLHGLQGRQAPTQPPNFFKTSYPSFSAENFIGLRLIHLVGIVVLVIGLSIGVKYAIDRELISEHARIGLAYSAGLLLYVLSWRLRKKYAAFSAILFSGAMASLYFTTYAAFVYYSLFPSALAFVLMIALTVFTVYQALTYNRQEIAVLGLVGAYAIPFLISSNSGRVELLFTYVALINTAVIFLAFKKMWHSVAWLAQAVTWLLLFGWALTRFTIAQQSTAYFFAAFFFLLFSLHALSQRLLRQHPLQRWQVQQIFNSNILLYLLAVVVYNATFLQFNFTFLNSSFSIFAALQAGLCYYFLPNETYLKKGFVLFSISLFLLFIANRWEGITVTLLWLLLAVLLFGTGFGLKAMWLRLTGVVLMGITLAKLVFLDSLRFSTVQKIVAYLTLGVLLLVVGFFYQRFKEKLFDKETGST
jgi:uncharacterized membrane protein